ncbi:hypothetical protein [Pedobacter segetis]|uniref:hypothetical protein n=1 Tax=Pedobacter segetis TaxID=2793069 RepID=UPI00190CE11F|nr:hypothetical protein [Pedobacter segetis]
MKAVYTLHKNLSAYIYAQNSFWNTGAGIDELFYDDGNKVYTKLNQVKRYSQSLGIGIRFSF